MKVIFNNGVEKELVGANIHSFTIDKAQRDGIELLFPLNEDASALCVIGENAGMTTSFMIKNEEVEEVYEGYTVLVGAGMNHFSYFDSNEDNFVEKLCCHISLCKKSEVEILKKQIGEIAELIPEETLRRSPALLETVLKLKINDQQVIV
jgi:hypothetical protein